MTRTEVARATVLLATDVSVLDRGCNDVSKQHQKYLEKFQKERGRCDGGIR